MEEVMPTNLAIDDKLITTAQKVGKFRTKKEAVIVALQFFIAQTNGWNCSSCSATSISMIATTTSGRARDEGPDRSLCLVEGRSP
jgi:hypothetical protein